MLFSSLQSHDSTKLSKPLLSLNYQNHSYLSQAFRNQTKHDFCVISIPCKISQFKNTASDPEKLPAEKETLSCIIYTFSSLISSPFI